MKKKILLISGVLLTLFIVVISVFIINKNNTNNLVLENKEKIKEQISGFNGITMMYETGPGTGEYSESKSSLWPESGYIFNENLSACENGGKLSWNDETKAVTLHSNKSDKCYVYFDAYIIPVINSVTPSNIETDSITLTVDTTNGNNSITTYYYSKDNGNSYETSNSNTYTFSGLDMGTVYNFSVYVEDSVGYESEVYNLSVQTDDIVLLADWVISQYNGTQGNNGIYYHTSSLVNSAGDNSYRYAGANPNNYVCFGSNASTCPTDNLYRIIGVFGDEVKLIKSTSYGNYRWSSGMINTWDSSTLNTETLNGTYLGELGSIWSNKIANHSWKVGGMLSSYVYNINSTPKIVFNYEVGNESYSSSYYAKIGLMYVSDYGFANSSNYWDEPINSDSNWMYLNDYEWTISQNADSLSFSVFYITTSGSIGDVNPNYSGLVTRPCFYLNSDVEYVSGSGTQSDPIRIN